MFEYNGLQARVPTELAAAPLYEAAGARLGRYCGSTSNDSVRAITATPVLLARFVSDSSIVMRGFALHVQVLGACA